MHSMLTFSSPVLLHSATHRNDGTNRRFGSAQHSTLSSSILHARASFHVLFSYLSMFSNRSLQPHHSFMCSLSSRLALKGQLKLHHTSLLAVIILTLYITSCEARHLRIHGKHSRKLPSSLPKDVIDVGAAKGQMRLPQKPPIGSDIDASMGKEEVVAEMNKEVASSGGVRNTRVVRVSQRLPHHEDRDDEGFHLDYAQPRTHTPWCSSSGSLRKRCQEIKVRSGMRERSMLGAGSNNEQVVLNATTPYAAESLVAMDYLDAHPAPAVHNR
ncbi:hypothetical protein ACP4OV_000473 [Aristida adscensionis]